MTLSNLLALPFIFPQCQFRMKTFCVTLCVWHAQKEFHAKTRRRKRSQTFHGMSFILYHLRRVGEEGVKNFGVSSIMRAWWLDEHVDSLNANEWMGPGKRRPGSIRWSILTFL